MGDVERLCDRILVIDHGRLAYDGDLRGLSRTVGAERVLVVDLAEQTTAAKVLAAVSAEAPVLDLSVEEPDIEDVVRRIYAASR